jgi:hypothetical protein
VTVLGEMPWFPQLTADALSSWAMTQLDPSRDLLSWLQ